MNEIKALFNENPNITKIDLSNKKISDLEIFKELARFQNLREIDISGNEFTKLPENLKEFGNLQVVDITNNLFENFEKVCSSLETLPRLIDLKINLSTQNEALFVLNSLTNLENLNGKTTKDDDGHFIDIDEKEIESISLDKEELEKLNVIKFNSKKIFSKIAEKSKLVNKDNEKKLQENYQLLLKTEIEKINKCIEHTVPNYVYASEIISSKIKISNFFFEKFLEYVEKKDTETSSIFKDILGNLSQSNSSIFDVIDKLFPKIAEKTSSLKNQLENSFKENKNLENTIHNLEEKLKVSIREKESQNKRFQEEKQSLQEKIIKLQEENNEITKKVLRKTKDMVNESMMNKKNEESQNMINQQNYETANKGKNVVIGPIGSKVLTKKQMKEVIDEIYTSKAAFDKKCMEARMPRETMEQHMYTFLNHKYGLKTLIIEWATSIINGIKIYSGEENDVCVFGKILRNECEEEFRIVLQKVKNTILELLNFYLKGKYPLKSSTDIKEMMNQKTNGNLLEEEWKEIVFYMYEQDDANFLYNKILELIKKKFHESKPIDQKKLTREELNNLSRNKDEFKIPFMEFQKIILDFQLKSHDKFLKNFIFIFKRFDSDNNGIISEDEFINLIHTLNIYKDDLNEQIKRILTVIDPFNKKIITFSECVSLFSMEFIYDDDGTGGKRKLSVLERVSLDEALLNA